MGRCHEGSIFDHEVLILMPMPVSTFKSSVRDCPKNIKRIYDPNDPKDEKSEKKFGEMKFFSS